MPLAAPCGCRCRRPSVGLGRFHRAAEGDPMTTLRDRPNTALMVIDVQNGVVAGSHDRDGVVGNINSLVDKARAEQVPGRVGAALRRRPRAGSDDWQIVDELSPDDGEPVVQKTLRRLLRGHRPRGGPGRPRRRAGRGHRRAERRVHPLHPARRPGPRLRRHAGRRRAHHRGPHRLRRADPRPGHLAHQPLLAVGAARRDGSGDVVPTGEVELRRRDPRPTATDRRSTARFRSSDVDLAAESEGG